MNALFGLIIGALASFAITGSAQGACGGASLGAVFGWLMSQLD